MLDSGAFRDFPGLLNYTVILPSECYYCQGGLCPYVIGPIYRCVTYSECTVSNSFPQAPVSNT